MKPIFFIHNQKCGGTSFASALEDNSINYIKTSSINLATRNLCFQKAINPKPGTIIAGHPSHIKYSSSEQAYRFFGYIYSNYKLIFPVRHPSRVILSWLYYYNTRIHSSLLAKYGNIELDKTPYTSILNYDQKILRMADHLSYCLRTKYIDKEGFYINAQNITEILVEFLKYCAFHVRGESSHSPALNFTRNLILPLKKLNILAQNSLPFPTSTLDQLLNSLDICIFDSEKIYKNPQLHPISKYFDNNFVNTFTATKKNTSKYPQGKAPTFRSQEINSFYEKLYPTEFQIYRHAI